MNGLLLKKGNQERILTAAGHVRGRASVAQLAEDSGIDQATLRAAAIALEAIGLESSAPAAR